jgi:catechol 2,3-dioxygenase-like lactoylglutathione lyase family enzyme
VLVIWDRWPVLAFYRNAFGLEQAASADARAPFDRLLAQESVDTLIGAPAGTYYRSIGLGGNELWEYRQRRPAPTPPWPTSIDRTGLAMLTMQVENLADARARIAKTGIGIVGEGALPSLNGKNAAGFHVRGPAGELIEIAARG